MGLTGEQLEQCFGTGFSPVKSITGFNQWGLNRPSTPVVDPEADVSEQQHSAEITFNAGTGELRLVTSLTGEGVWIPYLGNGKGTAGSKGWGTYSKDVANESWVATGPFSGCHVAVFTGSGRRFAHLITPASGYRAAKVEEQIAAIKKATASTGHAEWSMNGAGLGLAFFLNVRGVWRRRFVWVGPAGNVIQMNGRSAPV